MFLKLEPIKTILMVHGTHVMIQVMFLMPQVQQVQEVQVQPAIIVTLLASVIFITDGSHHQTTRV